MQIHEWIDGDRSWQAETKLAEKLKVPTEKKEMRDTIWQALKICGYDFSVLPMRIIHNCQTEPCPYSIPKYD